MRLAPITSTENTSDEWSTRFRLAMTTCLHHYAWLFPRVPLQFTDSFVRRRLSFWCHACPPPCCAHPPFSTATNICFNLILIMFPQFLLDAMMIRSLVNNCTQNNSLKFSELFWRRMWKTCAFNVCRSCTFLFFFLFSLFTFLIWEVNLNFYI